MIKVMIVDDQEMFRESLQIVLSSAEGLEVVGVASDVFGALRMMDENTPDIVLMDIRMPGTDGVEGTKLVKQRFPDTKVIMLTTFDDDEYIFGALKYGASGYLLKGSSISDLTNAVETAYRGGAVINPNVASKMIVQFSEMAFGQKGGSQKETSTFYEDFTESELKIIRLVGKGLSNKEIAQSLYLSEGTVRNYISGILLKAQVRDRTQLAILAVQNGMAD